jgi:hypothetical protein
MPKFIIKASEEVYYQEEIEAETRDEAMEKFYDMASQLDPVDYDGFNVYKIEEYGDD